MRIAETAYPLPDGRVLTIRSAEPKDAASLALHRCITSGETPFMARYPEECTRDAEALGAWLQGMAEDAQNFAVTAFDGETVVGDLYPCTVRVDAEYQLPVYRISHGPVFQKKSIRTSAWSFLYLKCPFLECSFRSRQRSPYIISSES